MSENYKMEAELVFKTGDSASEMKDFKDNMDDITKSLHEFKNTTADLTSSFKDFSKNFEDKFNAKESASKVSKLNNSLMDLGNSITGIVASVGGFLGVSLSMSSLVEQGNKLVETNNLFMQSLSNVSKEGKTTYGDLAGAQSKYYRQGLEYQKELYNALHLNTTELKNYQAMYFNMLNAQNIGEDASYQLSESLTNMAIDLASLFNTDVDVMAQKIQSGISGQAKALRQFGIDVTESSIQTELDNLGINASVEKLSYAEKELLRYMAIMDQVGYAQGDFARTFNSGANQIKLMRDEALYLAQTIGVVLTNAFSGAITAIRAFILVLQSAVESIADTLGIDLADAGTTATSSWEGVSDAVKGAGAGIGGATKKAKEFKKQLMGFDEINNITPPTQSAGSGGGGGGGAGGLGITDNLLKKLKEWDLGLGNVRDKAKELAEKGWFKAISAGVAGLLGLGLTTKVAGFVAKLKEIGTTLGATKGATTMSASAFATWALAIATAVEDVYLIIQGAGEATLQKALGNMTGYGSAFQAFFTRTGEVIINQLDSIETFFFADLQNLVSDITGVDLGEYTSFWDDVRSQFGLLTEDENKARQENLKFYQSLSDIRSGLGDNLQAVDKYVKTSEAYLKQLYEMTDANGKLKKGYEDRADVLLNQMSKATGDEYTRDGELIYRNGELIGSYDNLISKINETADQRKLQLEQEVQNQILAKMAEKQADAYLAMIEAEVQFHEDESEENKKALENAKTNYDLAVQQYKDYEAGMLNAQVESTNTLDTSLITEQKLWSSNAKKVWETNRQNWEDTFKTLDTKDKAFLLGITQDTEKYGNILMDKWYEVSTGSADDFKTGLDQMTTDEQASVLSMIRITDQNRNNVASAFGRLSQQSETKFNEALSKLSPDTQAQILNAMKTADGGAYHDQYVKAVGKLALNGDDEFFNNLDLDDTTKTELNTMFQSMQLTEPQAENCARLLGVTITDEMRNTLTSKNVGMPDVANDSTDGFYNSATGWRNTQKLASAGRQNAKTYSDAFKDKVRIGSPSKLFREYGNFVVEGFIIGTEDQETKLVEASNKMSDITTGAFENSQKIIDRYSKGISVDGNMNATTRVDYGTIQGQIATKLQSGNITNTIAMAIYNAMKNASVNVNIEAHADKGVIVKTATEGIQDFVNQTGELPFSIPI